MLFSEVNSVARCLHNSALSTVGRMGTRKPLQDWQTEDAERLNRLFELRAGMGQDRFASEYGIGTQGAVWQYLHGKIPLNLDALLKFCRGLRVKPAEISPTLAERLQEFQQPPADPLLAQLMDFYAKLSQDGRDALLGNANRLYVLENPERSQANPFPDASPVKAIAKPKRRGK